MQPACLAQIEHIAASCLAPCNLLDSDCQVYRSAGKSQSRRLVNWFQARIEQSGQLISSLRARLGQIGSWLHVSSTLVTHTFGLYDDFRPYPATTLETPLAKRDCAPLKALYKLSCGVWGYMY